MRLLLVELSRFFSRRAVVLTLLGGALLAALLAGSAAYESRPVSAQDLAVAQQRADAEFQQCLDQPRRMLGPGATEADCEAQRPQAEWYLERHPLELDQQLPGRGLPLLLLMTGIGVIVATTFAGADWSTGSMSNQLLFEPRRIRVWVAKAVAVVLGFTLAAAAVVAAFWAALILTADLRGLAVPPQVLTEVWQTSARGVGLAAAAALGAFALTMMFRHTMGTLALLFAYAVAGEALAATLPLDRVGRWALSNNVLAWVNDGTQVFDDRVCTSPTAPCDPFYPLGLPHAATYLGALLALAVVVSVVLFRRRDVP